MEAKQKEPEISPRSFNYIDDTYTVRSPYPIINIPEKTFVELILERGEMWKNLTAVVCGETGESYTYEQLFEKSRNIGRALVDDGLTEGDVVAFYLNNSPQYLAAILGASGFGLVISSINTLYKTEEIAHQLTTSNAKCVITSPEKAQTVTDAVSRLPNCGEIIVRCIEGPKKRHGDSVFNILNESSSNTEVFVNITRNLDRTLALLSSSSGTTGLPKVVCLSHKNITASLVQFAFKPATLFRETKDNDQDSILLVLPMFHNFGFSIAIQGLYHGSKLVTLPKFEGKSFLSTMEKYQISLLPTVPPIIQFIGQKEEVTCEQLQHLRCICVGAAPISETDIRRILGKAPSSIKIIQGYGQTESTILITQVPYGVENFASIGQPMVNTEIMVIDPKNGRPLPPFEAGEICCRGPQMFLGYLNDNESTKQVIEENGWCHTGDAGYYNDNGYFYIVDRIKELIKVKGFQVAPAELEAILKSHSKVEDAAVTGIPDEKNGEAPIGFVKIKNGESLTKEDLESFLSTRVAPYKIINTFYFVDVIPKTPAGKILRRKLKNMCNNV